MHATSVDVSRDIIHTSLLCFAASHFLTSENDIAFQALYSFLISMHAPLHV
jgi:hypothetical protein